MLKLIKLEWKKNRIGKQIRIAAVMTAVLTFFILAMAGELGADETIAIYGKSMLNASVTLFVNLSFIIFTGVMLASYIVSAYEDKTINLMFSYPIKRKKILFSKMLAVWSFAVAATVLCRVFIYAVLLLTSSYTHISTASIRFGDLSFCLELLISSMASVSITYIALFVGLRMKSSKAAIVTAVIIACLTQGNIGDRTLFGNLPFYLFLFVLAVVAVFLSVYRVETKDVM